MGIIVTMDNGGGLSRKTLYFIVADAIAAVGKSGEVIIQVG